MLYYGGNVAASAKGQKTKQAGGGRPWTIRKRHCLTLWFHILPASRGDLSRWGGGGGGERGGLVGGVGVGVNASSFCLPPSPRTSNNRAIPLEVVSPSFHQCQRCTVVENYKPPTLADFSPTLHISLLGYTFLIPAKMYLVKVPETKNMTIEGKSASPGGLYFSTTVRIPSFWPPEDGSVCHLATPSEWMSIKSREVLNIASAHLG